MITEFIATTAVTHQQDSATTTPAVAEAQQDVLPVNISVTDLIFPNTVPEDTGIPELIASTAAFLQPADATTIVQVFHLVDLKQVLLFLDLQ